MLKFTQKKSFSFHTFMLYIHTQKNLFKKELYLMCQFVKINLTGVESHMIQSLETIKNENIHIVNNQQDNTLQLQISNSLNDRILVNALNRFLDSFKTRAIYDLIPSWSFDENSSQIIGPNKEYFLTQKEVLFLKLLLRNEKVTTYKEIINAIWEDNQEVSQNAMRLFARNIRKKLPPKILKNFQGIGYKLVL